MRETKNILIVGGGLAGTFLASEAVRAGHAVTLVDQQDPGTASRVAAGLFNVVTGRKANRTWLAETLLEHLTAFFEHPEHAPLREFMHFRTIYRPYRTSEDFHDWTARALDPQYSALVRHCPDPRLTKQIENPMGGLEILPCGWVDTKGLLEGLQRLLEAGPRFNIYRERLDYAAISPETGCVDLGGKAVIFDAIVFAEGVAVKNNPWFEWLDIRPLKGQILDFKVPDFEPGFVLLRKVFMIPTGDEFYTAGSTYEKYFEDTGPTKEGVNELKGHIDAALKLPFEVVEARASVRPTTPNRRPVIGQHPKHERMYVLNGMGTKGVLQAPWCAVRMRAWMDGEEMELLPEIGLERFLKKISYFIR